MEALSKNIVLVHTLMSQVHAQVPNVAAFVQIMLHVFYIPGLKWWVVFKCTYYSVLFHFVDRSYITLASLLHTYTLRLNVMHAHTLRCLHSLSRSTKLLRTNLADHNVWKPCLSMLSLRDEECLVIATGVACNLLLEFSPSREVGWWTAAVR